MAKAASTLRRSRTSSARRVANLFGNRTAAVAHLYGRSCSPTWPQLRRTNITTISAAIPMRRVNRQTRFARSRDQRQRRPPEQKAPHVDFHVVHFDEGVRAALDFLYLAKAVLYEIDMQRRFGVPHA